MTNTQTAQNERDKIISIADEHRWELGENLHDSIIESIFADATLISNKVVTRDSKFKRTSWEVSLDKIVTSKWLGFPIMFIILAVVFWLTIEGANVPSAMLTDLLIGQFHPMLKSLSASIGIPLFLDGLLLDGAYLAMAWVISVMLPPMAIFFPLFTLLEDFGYLPRVAFNMDKLFQKAGAHGKQALTMSMGFGCNAAGVVAARVIDSPRERLIAII
ncbi:MAG: nucleoside recognition domain-containing protein, partial [Melioribacteraceae bacterium]